MSARYFALSLLTIGKIGVESIRAESTIVEPGENGLTNFVALLPKMLIVARRGWTGATQLAQLR